jgi:hypothetical protein
MAPLFCCVLYDTQTKGEIKWLIEILIEYKL